MRSTLILGLGVAGAAGVLAVAVSGALRRESRAHAPVGQRLPGQRADELVTRLDLVASQLDRLDRLSERVDCLEAELATARGGAPERAGNAHNLQLEELHRRAKELSADEGRAGEAIEAWALLAQSTTDPEVRAESWVAQAKLCADAEIAAELLTNAVAALGLENRTGQEALFLLGFCQQGDIRASVRIWRQLVAVPGLSRDLAVRARKMIGDRLATGRQYEAAVAEYESLAADYRNDEDEMCRKLADAAASMARNIRLHVLKDGS